MRFRTAIRLRQTSPPRDHPESREPAELRDPKKCSLWRDGSWSPAGSRGGSLPKVTQEPSARAETGLPAWGVCLEVGVSAVKSWLGRQRFQGCCNSARCSLSLPRIISSLYSSSVTRGDGGGGGGTIPSRCRPNRGVTARVHPTTATQRLRQKRRDSAARQQERGCGLNVLLPLVYEKGVTMKDADAVCTYLTEGPGLIAQGAHNLFWEVSQSQVQDSNQLANLRHRTTTLGLDTPAHKHTPPH